MRSALLALSAALALAAGVAATPHAGGPADAGVEVACDLPVGQRLHNVGGSDGAGLCVFTSIGHAARYQDVDALKDFQSFMRKYPGGGYPQKVDQMIARKCGDHKPSYLQYEGTDLAVLRAALASGRMPSVTYDGRDSHYRSHIEHMVNLVCLTETVACVLDNNFVADGDLEWLSADEFKSRWIGGPGRKGWAVILLDVGCPPTP